MAGRFHRRSFLRLGAALALIVAAFAFSAVPAGATNAWGSYHWARASSPFAVPVVDSVTTAWGGYLGSVSTDWTASSVLDTPTETGADDNATRKKCPAVTGKMRACNAAYGFNGWLGQARIWTSGSHIVKATAKVNDSYFNLSTYNDPSAKRHVFCQEVGHTLGLDHQRAVDSKTCMDDRNGLKDPAFVSPNAHDYAQLETIYNGHFESSSSGASLPGQGNGNSADEDSNGPDFGVPVGGDGQETLFVKDLGGGRKLYTWVFWAQPGAANAK